MASKIGEILQAKGQLTGPQLEEALKKQAGTKVRLGTILVEMGIVDVDQVAEALSEQRGFPPATRKDFEGATAITLVCIPAPFAQQFKAFPLRREAGKLVVAFATPYERAQVEPVRSMAGMEIVPCIAPEFLLLYYQEMRYRLRRPERFAHWSPPPTTPAAPGAGASPPPAAHPAPEARQGTALFGVAPASPLSAPPRLSIPPPSAGPAAAPSQASKFSLLDPKPSAVPAPTPTPSVPSLPQPARPVVVSTGPLPAPLPGIPAPPQVSKPTATPSPMPAFSLPSVSKPIPTPSPMPARSVPSASKPIPTPSPMPAIAVPSVSKPVPAPSPMPAIAAPPQVSKPVPTPAPMVAVPAPPVVAPAPAAAPAKKADESATVRVESQTVPEEAKRSEPERTGETVRVASQAIPPEARPPESLASEPEPFSTPKPPGSSGLEGPTTPISPELLAIAQQPESPSSFFASVPISDEEPPIVQGDSLVDGPAPITAAVGALPDPMAGSGPGWGDAMPASMPESAPVAPAPPVVAPPVAAAPPAAAPLPSVVVASANPPVLEAAKPTRRTTKEEMPAAILASEVETGLKVAQNRRETDRDVTQPRIIAARDLFDANIGKALEGGPAIKSLTTTNLYGRPDSDSPPTEETTLPAGPPVSASPGPALPVAGPTPSSRGEQSLAQLASELSEPIVTPKAEFIPSPSEIAKTQPPPPRKTVKDRPDQVSQRPLKNAALAAPPGGSKLFLGIGIGAAAALVLGGLGVAMKWPKPPPPPAPPVVCKQCPPLPPPPPEAQKATLEGADGLVERLGLDGEWVPAAANAAVADGEQVRTGQGARAKLRVGAGLVVVGEYSRVGLRAATTAAHRFRLNAGFASFQYSSAALPFEIELAGGKVVASGKADVTAFSDDLRTALSPRAGTVTISAANGAGKKIELAAGKQVVVAADGTFGDATDLPPKLELNLEAPRKGDRVWILEGTVVGGPARVVVEGTPVQVDAENKFSHQLKMPAKGPFNAAAVDVAGHRLAQEFPPQAAPAPKKPAPKKDKKGPGKGK